VLSQDIVKRYEETVCAFKSVNQINQFQIELGHALTPLETAELLPSLHNKTLPPAATEWLRAHKDLLASSKKPLVPHQRENVHEGVTFYRGKPEPGQQRHLLIAFTGDARRLMMPICLFLQECNMANLDVLLLDDRSKCFYLNGIEGFALNMKGLIERLKTLYDRRDYGSVVSLGTSGGGLAALWVGTALQLDKAISVGGPSHLYTDSRLSARARPFGEFEELVKSEEVRLPKMVYALGDGCAKDQQKLLELSKLVRMEVVRVEGCEDHNIFYYLFLKKQLGSFLRQLIQVQPQSLPSSQPKPPRLSTALNPLLDQNKPHPTLFSYVIFSQQRTGSTWLCARLINTGYLGVPSEYLNGRVIPQLSQRLLAGQSQLDQKGTSLASYMQLLERARTTPGGCFGIKVQINQLMPLFKNDHDSSAKFLQRFNAMVVMTRRDKVGQAISGAISTLSGKWFSDGQEAPIGRDKVPELVKTAYSLLARYEREAVQMEALCAQYKGKQMHLDYEDMLADADGVMRKVTRLLEPSRVWTPEADSALLSLPEPPPGLLAKEVRERLLEFIQGQGDIARARIMTNGLPD
jgi:LPS sulfotransferase NodH